MELLAEVSETQEKLNEGGYLEGLNPEQREAVLATEGPVLVLSGAGTGKTKVLTTRIAHIIMTHRAYPSQVLAVTFTNKAAKEMVRRVADLIGQSVDGLWIGTFHSIAAKILRRHAEIVGLTSNFTILDEDDQMRLIKPILQQLGIDDKKWPAKVFVNVISGLKDKAITPDKADANTNASYCLGKAAEVYRLYQRRLKELNAADFGDLLLHNLTIFRDHPEVLDQYGRRFRYIMVDEYQDTNVSQYMWLRLLAIANNNIAVVGDDDQSIYGWRGAEIENILKFEKDFENAKVIRLERNYRSTPQILAAASHLISHNTGRLGKTLWTDDSAGEKINIITCLDDRDEARIVADNVRSISRFGSPLSEMAVLVRAGFQTRSFEERFLADSIPYRIIGGLKFYERQEIKDAIAYLRLIHQPDDDLALERIINLPRRGMGDTTIASLIQEARAGSYSLLRACRNRAKAGGFKGKSREAMDAFITNIDDWHKLSKDLLPTQLAELALEESGYIQMWKNEKSPDAEGRIDNLKELISAIGEFETLGEFLEHVSLVTDSNDKDFESKVSVMTLHAAKGLEFSTVFLPGWEEGIFPSQRSMDEKGSEGLEEERRLAYVGITRARKRLFILHSLSRRVFNQFQNNLPSRFISELPDEHLAKSDKSGVANRTTRESLKAQLRSIFDDLESPGHSPQPVKEEKPASSSSSSKIRVGERVFHQKFGYGRVSSIDGNKLDIDFEKAGRKKVMQEFIAKV